MSPSHRRNARAPGIGASAVILVLCSAIALPAPAGAAQGRSDSACGKAVINQYFNTGRIGYHAQECYAAALKQVDPDAKMYSGIMGAIRAARARDKAKDEAAAQPADDAGSSAGSSGDLEPVQPMELPVETVPVDAAPVPDEAADDPVVAEVAAVDLTEDQAVVTVPTVA
ncbi:MAG: hypothetical protein RL190_401 [Actinomycetota bacterium]